MFTENSIGIMVLPSYLPVAPNSGINMGYAIESMVLLSYGQMAQSFIIYMEKASHIWHGIEESNAYRGLWGILLRDQNGYQILVPTWRTS
jgi:hypothetical protein